MSVLFSHTTYDIGVSVYELVPCRWADELAHEVLPYCVHALVCLCFSMTGMVFQMFISIQLITAAVLMVILDVLTSTALYSLPVFLLADIMLIGKMRLWFISVLLITGKVLTPVA